MINARLVWSGRTSIQHRQKGASEQLLYGPGDFTVRIITFEGLMVLNIDSSECLVRLRLLNGVCMLGSWSANIRLNLNALERTFLVVVCHRDGLRVARKTETLRRMYAPVHIPIRVRMSKLALERG